MRGGWLLLSFHVSDADTKPAPHQWPGYDDQDYDQHGHAGHGYEEHHHQPGWDRPQPRPARHSHRG